MEAFALNQNKWGVCGFVSVIQAAYCNNINKKLLQGTDYDTLFPVIKNFCSSNKALESELLNFSAVFGVNYTYKSLDEVVSKMQLDKTLEGDNIGIAMTANGVSLLCKSLGFKNYDFHGTTATTNKLADNLKSKNTIFGLGKATGGNYRNGLLHWVYSDAQGVLMSWGEKVTLDEITQQGYDKVTHYLPSVS
jgi:hypothetical protein